MSVELPTEQTSLKSPDNFERVSLTFSDKMVNAFKNLFTAGYWSEWKTNELYKALFNNDFEGASKAIKEGADRYLTNERLIVLIENGQDRSVQFLMTQMKEDNDTLDKAVGEVKKALNRLKKSPSTYQRMLEVFLQNIKKEELNTVDSFDLDQRFVAAIKEGEQPVVDIFQIRGWRGNDYITENIFKDRSLRWLGSLKQIIPLKLINVNERNHEGITLLQTCVVDGNHQAVRYLLSQGADPDLVTKYGTALHVALYHEDEQMVKILREYHANTTIAKDGRKTIPADQDTTTPFFIATSLGPPFSDAIL